MFKKYNIGEKRAAKDIFDRLIAPVNRLGSTNYDIYFHIQKQILVKKGIIKNSFVRKPTLNIDNLMQEEINILIEEIL